MNIPGAYPKDADVRALSERPNAIRSVSEIAEQRAQPSYAMDWASWNAKHKAAASAKIPVAKSHPWPDQMAQVKPEDTTMSPDGNKLHVIVPNGKGQPEQHEFTKQGDKWQHHTGSDGGKAAAGVQSALKNIVANHSYTSTRGEDIPLPKGK